MVQEVLNHHSKLDSDKTLKKSLQNTDLQEKPEEESISNMINVSNTTRAARTTVNVLDLLKERIKSDIDDIPTVKSNKLNKK